MELNSNDLRAYAIILWRWKWLIVVCTVLALAAATVVTYTEPLQYESSAVVVLTRPTYNLAFDERILSQDSAPWPSRWYTVGPTYRLLAEDPSLVQQVVDALGESLPSEERSADVLGEHLSVREVSIEGAVQLVVSHQDPDVARSIADTWARLYAERLDRLYGQDAQDLTTLTAQLEVARKDLEAARADLARFQQSNRLPTLEKQLLVRQGTLGACFSIQDRLDLVIEDAQALRTRIQKGNAPGLEYPMQLAILYLELGSLGMQDASAQSGSATGNSPIALQVTVNPTTLAAASAADQLRYLDELIAAVQAKKAALGTRATQLEHEIASLKSEIVTESAALNDLSLARDVASETVNSLTRKSKEVQVSVELGGEMARVAGPAVRPGTPASSSLLLRVGLAAVGGLVLGVCGAFVLEFIKGWPDEQPSTMGEP